MKIAQFIDTYDVGGAETMMLRLSKALKQQGHDIVVLHMGSDYLVRACERLELPHCVVPEAHLYRSIITVPLFSLKFAKFLKQNKFELLHTHLYGPITGCFLGCFFYSIPHVGTLHDVYLVQQRFGRGVLLRLAQAMKTRLVSVSKDMQAFYENYVPFCRPIKTLPNGIEIQESAAETQVDPLAAYTHDSVRVVTVGRLIPLKRQIQQLEALAELLKTENISLFFIGDGPDRESLENKIKQLELTSHVFVLGQRDDVTAILEFSDIFVLASESEGLSCSIIEAMGAGLPCVVSNVGGNSELIEHQTNGLVFQVDDKISLAHSVAKLAKDSELRKTMGEASKVKAKNHYSIDAMSQGYQTLYQQYKNNGQ